METIQIFLAFVTVAGTVGGACLYFGHQVKTVVEEVKIPLTELKVAVDALTKDHQRLEAKLEKLDENVDRLRRTP